MIFSQILKINSLLYKKALLNQKFKNQNKNILIVTHQPIIDIILKFFVGSANCSVVVNEQITEINIGKAWTKLKC